MAGPSARQNYGAGIVCVRSAAPTGCTFRSATTVAHSLLLFPAPDHHRPNGNQGPLTRCCVFWPPPNALDIELTMAPDPFGLRLVNFWHPDFTVDSGDAMIWWLCAADTVCPRHSGWGISAALARFRQGFRHVDLLRGSSLRRALDPSHGDTSGVKRNCCRISTAHRTACSTSTRRF